MRINNLTDIKSILLDNQTVKQTIFKNTFWLMFATGINKFLRFILFVYVARILGATEYGKFTFAMSFVALFIMFSDFGLPQIITREFSKDKEREKEFSSLLSLKILLTFGVFILIFIGSFLVTQDHLIRKIITILALSSLAESFIEIIFSFFRARQKMEYQAITIILESLITVGVGIFILFYFPSVKNLSYSYLLASLIGLIFILIVFNIKIQQIFLRLDKLIWKKFLIISWPLAIMGVLASIYNQTDSVMLGYFKQITETGWYNAAYRIIAVALLFSGLIATSIFPVLSKTLKESKDRLKIIWSYFVETMILLAIPMTAGGILLASKIIFFIYGASYDPSIFAFQILIAAAGIAFLYAPFHQILIVFDQQKKIFGVVALGAIFNVVFNAILIPKFSLYGAAVATLFTHILVGILLLRLISKLTFVSPLNFRILSVFMGAIVSAFVMCVVISRPLIYNLNVFFPVLTGVVVYIVSIFVFKYMLRYFIVFIKERALIKK